MATGNLNPIERLVLWVVILGGIVALVFAFPYIGKNIREPLKLKPRTVETLSEQEARELRELKEKDTDGDGLVDYDELNVWKTSPYLADSDSDGYDDKTEIESGHDPNCPRGKDCVRSLVEVPSTEPMDIFPEITQEQLFGESAGLESVLGAMEPDEIRHLLIEQGVPEEMLNQLDDATLQEVYQQSLGTAFEQLREQGQELAE